MKFIITTMAWLCLCMANVAYAQMLFKGQVLDSSTGMPIKEANVRLLQTTIGVATNANGEFVLKNVPNGVYQMRVSAINYATSTIKLESSNEQIIFKLSQSPINLNQIVITGTGTHRKLKDTPVPVEVISGRELKNAGITNFKDAVTMLSPSFSFTQTPMANYTSMNGLSNEHLLILVDGQKMAGNISGATDVSRINMNNVKRIEILKGAASSIYGSDAIGGVINIITEQTKNKITATSLTKYEEYNQLEQDISANFTTNKFGSYTSYNRKQADGWQLNPEAVNFKNGVPDKPYPTIRRASDKFFSNMVSQKFVANPSKSLSLYANGSFSNKETQRPSTEIDKTGYEYDLVSKSYNFGLGAQYLLGESNLIALDLYNDNFENSNKYIIDNKSFHKGQKTLNQKQHYYSANLKSQFKIGKYNKLYTGLEYVKDNLENPDALSEKKSMYTLAAYAQDELKIIGGLQAVLGLRYAYNENFGSKLSPKATLMYTLGPVNTRLSYSAGFRTPTLKELHYIKEKGSSVSYGNQNLNPENSNYYSLNVEYLNKHFTAAITGYINKVKNLINLEPMKNPELLPNYNPKYTYKQYQNISSAKVEGLDITLRSYIGLGFTLGGGYSYVKAKDLDKNLPLARSTKHSGNVNANWAHTWGKYDLNINLSSHIQGKRYETSQEDAPGFSLWNLAIRNSFNLFGCLTLEPSVGINNIFNYKDDRYYGYYYSTLSPGRTIYGQLLIKFYK